MEEDFEVAPGGDPKAIALDVAGARKVSISPQGELVLASADGDLYLRKPTVYQTIAGARREIPGRYQLSGENRVGIRSRTLRCQPALGNRSRTSPIPLT